MFKQACVEHFFLTFAAMFERLQKKWKVNGVQLVLILCTFAIGGSLTGFVGKKIMNALSVSQDWLWAILYIIIVTLLWPLAVLLVSIPFGQFSFFKKYIKKIGEKMGVGSRESTIASRQSAVGSPQSDSHIAGNKNSQTNV